MLIYRMLMVVALSSVVACDQDAAPSHGTPKTTISESPNHDELRVWREVGEPALMKELARDTAMQGWSRYILVGGSSVDSRKMIVIPRAGVTATELRELENSKLFETVALDMELSEQSELTF